MVSALRFLPVLNNSAGRGGPVVAAVTIALLHSALECLRILAECDGAQIEMKALSRISKLLVLNLVAKIEKTTTVTSCVATTNEGRPCLNVPLKVEVAQPVRR